MTPPAGSSLPPPPSSISRPRPPPVSSTAPAVPASHPHPPTTRPSAALRTRSYDSAGRPKPAPDKAAAAAASTAQAAKPLAHSTSASSRLTSFLRHPPPTHTHIPPSLAGSLLLESHHSPFHRRTLSRKDPSGGPRRPSLANSLSESRVPNGNGGGQVYSPTAETAPATQGWTDDGACSRVPSHSSSASSSSDGGSSSGSGSSSETTSSSEDDGAPSPPGQGNRREYFPEDLLLSPWLTPQEFDKSTPSITRREMEARLGNMRSYFDGD